MGTTSLWVAADDDIIYFSNGDTYIKGCCAFVVKCLSLLKRFVFIEHCFGFLGEKPLAEPHTSSGTCVSFYTFGWGFEALHHKMIGLLKVKQLVEVKKQKVTVFRIAQISNKCCTNYHNCFARLCIPLGKSVEHVRKERRNEWFLLHLWPRGDPPQPSQRAQEPNRCLLPRAK